MPYKRTKWKIKFNRWQLGSLCLEYPPPHQYASEFFHVLPPQRGWQNMNYRKCRYNNYVCLSCVLSVSEKHVHDLHFKCYRCGRQYKSKLGLKSHFIVNHADKVVRFKCQICNAQYGTQAMLTRHKHVHKFENSCFICLEKIDTKEKLKVHMKDVHNYYICTFVISCDCNN
jgi:hypothetical protein